MDVWKVSGTTVEIDGNDIEGRFVYNPETGYLLLPVDVYGSLSGEQQQELNSVDFIEGLHNHEAISRIQ